MRASHPFLVSLLLCSVDALSLPKRRDFLATSASSAAALATDVLASPIPSASASDGDTLQPLTTTSKLQLPPIGLGAWAWGDAIFWKYDPRNDEDLKKVFEYALSQNLAFFDTAELYGLGRSEDLIGRFRKELCKTEEEYNKVTVASKFAALPWRSKREDVVNACKKSVQRLGSPIDLYQIHFPNSWSNEEYWDGIADCYDRGLVKAVGVSNYGVEAVRACHAKLAQRGIRLASNQIQLSLLYRWPIDNGLLDTCAELELDVLSYSPLALGFLTGKYSKDNLPSGPRANLGKDLFAAEDGSYEKLLATMNEIASKHDAVPSQVALNWARAKGTIPIPGARTVNQAKQNLASLDWNLSKDEERQLDEASAKVTGFITPDKNPFPREDINTKLKMYDS